MNHSVTPTAPRLRIERLTVAQWFCLRTSLAVWREHNAPPSRFTFTLSPHQPQQPVVVLGDGASLRPDLGAQR
ncbi:hypothetical protein CH282_15715 [Rhodococcus sp. 06-418-1B]|nr:hypothetical protein [Rhodococcus sp. 06-418-1B]OZC83407.1 hypothetical protein CH282_15715 [Rhodococcus sp. 06-418-1B]